MGQLTTIDFHGDTLFAVEREEGVFIAVTPICQVLGLDAKKQRERIQRDPILSEGGATMALPSAGGAQDTFCLRMDLINGWLFTIDESRVREEARERVLDYKRECYRVLFRHFYGSRAGAAIGGDPGSEESVSIRRTLVTETRQLFGHKAAKELWFKLGLPVTPAMLEASDQAELPLTTTPAA